MADQIFKKRQGHRKLRKIAEREIAPFRYLIVCEGEKTEPLYFEGLRNIINSKYAKKLNNNFEEGISHSDKKPCTKVYELIEELLEYLT